MEQIVLPPLLEVIFDRLASPLLEKIGIRWNFKDNIEKVRALLPPVQALLEDAEEQQVSNRAVRNWLSDLKDAIYDAEDLFDKIEEASLEAELLSYKKQFASGISEWRKSRSIFGGFPDALRFLAFSESAGFSAYAEEASCMLTRLKRTAVEGLRLQLAERGRVGKSSGRRDTGSFIIESEVFGRKEDREKMTTQLLTYETTQNGDASFIPIYGLGGIGKTTLTKVVYHDERVTKHFDMKAWAFVSVDFDAKKVIKALIESATKRACELSELDALQSELWGLFHEKRYLIVLDDVWSEDQNEWDKLRPLFRGGVDGSRIIVTTRSKKVALSIAPATSHYCLECLPEEDCWALFKQRAFDQGEEEEFPNLLPIGQNIVKKCGGLPLAVKSMGSLMRFRREEREWLLVQESQLWNMDICQSGILPALRLSYLHLPSHLKRCFEFCSIFPKSYEIKKEKLIHLWMAEGLISSVEGRKQPEDIGNDYFNDLLWMSFFQKADDCNDGYKMHDIIHALARSVGGKGSHIIEHGLPPSRNLSSARRSSVVCDFKAPTIPEALYQAKRLRTLLLFAGFNFTDIPQQLYYSFDYLRVLDFSGCGLAHFGHGLEHFGQVLKQFSCLKYLDFSYTHITTLPDSISYLPHLQTLNLFNCYRLKTIPDLRRMSALRHLILTGCEALTTTMTFDDVLSRRSASKVLRLERFHLERFGLERFGPSAQHQEKAFGQLQTLPMCIVGGHQDLEILTFATNLRGELKIKGLENLRSEADANKAELAKKYKLESLGLYWGKNDDGDDREETNIARFQERIQPLPSGSSSQGHEPDAAMGEASGSSSQGHEPDAAMGEEAIKGLRPHGNLKRLVVNGYPGISFPRWTLPDLIVVHLSNFKNCQHLPVLGNLNWLKTLSLTGMKAVKSIGKEFYGEGTKRPFPELQELVLRDFPNLQEWSSPNDDQDGFRSLRKVIIIKCPNLTRRPLFRSLQHLELRECNRIILTSNENLKSLSFLAIEEVPELTRLSGGILASSSLLTSLEIKSCPELRSLPPELGNLTALQSLTIRFCDQLYRLPSLQNLKALESLEIGNCYSLLSMPDDAIGALSSLRYLSIENCRYLTSLLTSFLHLTSLEHLTISFCPRLDSFPEGVQHLSALRRLSIISCPRFPCLPEELQHVSTLQSLEIGMCHGLTVLPEWIGRLTLLRTLTIFDCENLKHLPGGLKALSGLQHLSIQDCPELEERCKREIGEDWQKIKHIPHRHIGPLNTASPA